jgi:hypothetical protein
MPFTVYGKDITITMKCQALGKLLILKGIFGIRQYLESDKSTPATSV